MSDESAAPPQFGLVDVIEAFTAMRHEFRNQTKESREVAEQLGRTAEDVERFAGAFAERMTESLQTLKTRASVGGTSSADAPQASLDFAVTLAEIEHSVSRAVEAASRSITSFDPASITPSERVSATERLATLGPIARFFCRRFARQVDEDASEFEREVERRGEQNHAGLSATVSGLNMTVDHLRRRLTQHGVQRIDVLGQPFDGNLMRAVEVVNTADVPPGHVAEQLSPAYRYDSRVIRFADVRLARPSSSAV